tara:strand:- start:797 stop:1042 length:246 start_codon:yes stop_codon:yes gene_type:complete
MNLSIKNRKKIIQRFAGGCENPDNIDNIGGIPIQDHAGNPVTLHLHGGVYWLQSHAHKGKEPKHWIGLDELLDELEKGDDE